VTDRRTYRRTEFSSLDRVCLSCSAVINTTAITIDSLCEFFNHHVVKASSLSKTEINVLVVSMLKLSVYLTSNLWTVMHSWHFVAFLTEKMPGAIFYGEMSGKFSFRDV